MEPEQHEQEQSRNHSAERESPPDNFQSVRIPKVAGSDDKIEAEFPVAGLVGDLDILAVRVDPVVVVGAAVGT